MKLDGSIISLEFAPLTKGIRIGNIPPGTSSDDIKYKFSSRKICGGQVTEVKLDKKSGVANVYFEKSSGMGLPHCVYFTRFLQYHITRDHLFCNLQRNHICDTTSHTKSCYVKCIQN